MIITKSKTYEITKYIEKGFILRGNTLIGLLRSLKAKKKILKKIPYYRPSENSIRCLIICNGVVNNLFMGPDAIDVINECSSRIMLYLNNCILA